MQMEAKLKNKPHAVLSRTNDWLGHSRARQVNPSKAPELKPKCKKGNVSCHPFRPANIVSDVDGGVLKICL
jgi:hypothetical protein